MLPLSRANLTPSAFIRILFRRYKTGSIVLALSLSAGLFIASKIPMQYEAQTIIEKKQLSFVSRGEKKEFDITRFTSEIQSTVTLLKSRFMVERWMKELGYKEENDTKREEMLTSLYKDLSVQPVNFTGLFIIKIRAKSPEAAVSLSKALCKTYDEWSADQNREQAKMMIDILNERIKQLQMDLSGSREKLKQMKKGQSLNLSGSAGVDDIKTDIESKEKLYDMSLFDIEEAQRLVNGGQLSHIQIVAPTTVSSKPVFSRYRIYLIVICLSLILTGFFMALLEWLDKSVHRAGDIYDIFSSAVVLTVPYVGNTNLFREDYVNIFQPLIKMVREIAQQQQTVVVQLVSPAKGDGKTEIAGELAQIISGWKMPCCIVHLDENEAAENEDENFALLHLSRGVFEQRLRELSGKYRAIILDIETKPHSFIWNSLEPISDITCIVISSGKISRSFLYAAKQRLESSPHKKLVFMLNFYREPIPRWLQQYIFDPS